MPAATEPGDFAVTAQVPAAAFALQVGAAPSQGAPGCRRRLVSAALALRPSSRRPPGSRPLPAQLGRDLGGGVGGGRQPRTAQRDQPPWGRGPPVRAFGPRARGVDANQLRRAFARVGAAWRAEARGL